MQTQPDNARSKNLTALLSGLTSVALPDVAVTDLSLDSRAIGRGGAFVALPGLRTHGVGFAPQAVSAGATVVLWEPVANVAAPKLPDHVALVAIPDLSALVGAIADRFFDAPSAAMTIAGVTGTNGKTTTAWLIASALRQLGQSAAYAGTIGYGFVDALKASSYTTPDCITLHRQLAELRGEGVRHMGIEVSSHALDQQRVAGVRFDTAIFTNLTRDHLEYHGTLAAYGAAKARLFAWPGLQHAVINAEDAFGRELAAGHRGAALTVCARSLTSLPALATSASLLLASRVTAAPAGLEISIDGAWGTATLHSRFVGDFNVDNLLAVLATLLGWNIPLDRAVAALEHCVAPPGRMETFAAPGKPLAVVDYAHSPDALEKALLAIRRHSAGRVICVFGCGGDRDPGKRPLMGAIAERLADVVIVTDDNPRTEDGDAIVANILQGLSSPQRATVERDRAAAIERAIATAGSRDAVLIAGKGHEDYQITAAGKRYFSDRDVVLAALRRTP